MTPGPEVLEWILDSSEPAARWIVQAHLLDAPEHARLAAAEREAILDDPATDRLIARLADWDATAELDNP